MMITVVADKFIPFLQGRAEEYANFRYLDPADFTPGNVRDADALLIRTRTRCNADLLEGSKVQFIASGTIGMDQFDLPYCASKGIDAHNSPGCNAPAVAQYVWSSILHLGLDPRQLTIGIVGHGHIGTIVAEWGRHLGARILLCDPPKAETGARGYLPLEELLEQSDVVTLHTPLTRTGSHPTFHLIGEKQVERMRLGALLINAARGPIVDTPAVTEAAGKGLIKLVSDCWEGEPDRISPRQLELSLIATPHVAGYSLQGKQRATRMILENLAAHFGLPVARSAGEKGIRVWDLPEPYTPIESITAARIAASYDPMADDAMLRRNPDRFETMRDHYQYRSEPQIDAEPQRPPVPAKQLYDLLAEGNVDDFCRNLQQLFSRYPSNFKFDVEQDFQRVLFAISMLSGAKVQPEVSTNLGRIDLLLKAGKFTYIFELKRDKTPEWQ